MSSEQLVLLDTTTGKTTATQSEFKKRRAVKLENPRDRGETVQALQHHCWNKCYPAQLL